MNVTVIEAIVERPIDAIVPDWNLLDDSMVAKFTMFRTMGQNIFGIRRHTITRTQIVDMTKHMTTALLELGPGGIIVPPFAPMRMHITAAGTPHRIPHSLGYWHINDMDELYLPPAEPCPGDLLGHNVIVMQNPTGREGDRWAWYCEHCSTLLFERWHCTGTLGMDFPSPASSPCATTTATRATAPARTGGHVNPLGYNWNPAKDTAEERAARTLW